MKVLSIASLLFLASTAAQASCPTNVGALQPEAGQVTGCPVYFAMSATRCWWSDSVDAPPFDNNFYGLQVVDQRCQQVATIVSQNWAATQLSNLFGSDIALAPVTFALSGKTFFTVTGTVAEDANTEVKEIQGRIRQGF